MAAEASTEEVVAQLNTVRERVAFQAALRPAGWITPTLIAVSKTKPAELLSAAYAEGQRDFGENYVQEVVAKAPELPDDLRWHFIGHLQTNKVKELLRVPNLYCVHTVDSIKLAAELQKRAVQLRPDQPLRVFAQVRSPTWNPPFDVLSISSQDMSAHRLIHQWRSPSRAAYPPKSQPYASPSVIVALHSS